MNCEFCNDPNGREPLHALTFRVMRMIIRSQKARKHIAKLVLENRDLKTSGIALAEELGKIRKEWVEAKGRNIVLDGAMKMADHRTEMAQRLSDNWKDSFMTLRSMNRERENRRRAKARKAKKGKR